MALVFLWKGYEIDSFQLLERDSPSFEPEIRIFFEVLPRDVQLHSFGQLNEEMHCHPSGHREDRQPCAEWG